MTLSPYAYTPITSEYVAPEQFYPAPAPSWPKRIAFAVLQDAISCATVPRVGGSPRRAAARIQQEARDWIRSADASYPGAFVNICETLGLAPEQIRRGVLRPGFRLPNQGLRAGLVAPGNAPKQTTVDLLQRIALKEQRRARRAS